MQETAGLNCCSDRLNAFCFFSKTNFITVLQKSSSSLARLQVKGILYSVNEERKSGNSVGGRKKVYYLSVFKEGLDRKALHCVKRDFALSMCLRDILGEFFLMRTLRKQMTRCQRAI